MLITFLIMKLTFEGILKECNRIALEQDLQENAARLKSELARLEINYYKGLVNAQTYEKKQSEILKELDELAKQKPGSQDGGTSIEF